MLFLVAALMLMGILLGTAAHVPATVTLVGTAAIAVWLMVFAVREWAGRHHRAGRQGGSS
ncbi:hypothetical protein [Streptomyces sp. G-G2]|uniref:hypothetical protein n=1 Tax=Streptomyces sp. G-G2 TaxID=3046201 RepID=UPI0024BAA850|nr:hypothetical protein [Streptomyces sp. G-G2]MDJ0382393.1 hypothetical protein [Streptomyces sp. G-G2]